MGQNRLSFKPVGLTSPPQLQSLAGKELDRSKNADTTDILLFAFGAAMAQTTAAELQRKFGEFQHQALREPVEITRHGRRELVLMSADHYDWLVAAAKRTHRTADAASVVAEAVRRAEMDPEHANLDDLLK